MADTTTRPSAGFAGGRNIAMKVPPHLWEETVGFYRDVVGLTVLDDGQDWATATVGFEFGANRLWIDRVETVSQAELWLQLTTDDLPAAAQHLDAGAVSRCHAIEPLPLGSTAFWITSPASIVHLISGPEV